MHPKTQNSQARSKPQDSPGARRRKRGLLAIAAVAMVAIAATFIPGAMSPHESGPTLTHTITRGDLVVSVTEQGTLESSNNTELKCKVRGWSLVTWVIEDGTEVKAGDELVRLDTKRIEDAISLQTTNFYTATATLEQSKAEVARAEIAIPTYLEGSYRTQLKSLERGLKIAETNLLTARKMLVHSNKLFKRGYVTELEVEGNAFTVPQAELELKVVQTEIDVLKKYTKEMQMETLNGNLNANKSKLESDKAGLTMDKARLDRAKEELENCVIKAETSGLVIYPTARPWEYTPKIEEGAMVYTSQTMLLMPDLAKMQVKISIHESFIDRMRPGLAAQVSLPDRTLTGEVSSVASVTGPAGEWNGYVVKYDTLIKLPSVPGLRPGMSAEVEVILDRHTDVLTIPVAALVETAQGDFCWVKTAAGAERRSLQLGDTNDVFTVVKAGLKEGDEVVLHPFAFKEAQALALKPRDEAKVQEPESTEPSGSTRGRHQAEVAR